MVVHSDVCWIDQPSQWTTIGTANNTWCGVMGGGLFTKPTGVKRLSISPRAISLQGQLLNHFSFLPSEEIVQKYVGIRRYFALLTVIGIQGEIYHGQWPTFLLCHVIITAAKFCWISRHCFLRTWFRNSFSKPE